jgi:hypothetical protein
MTIFIGDVHGKYSAYHRILKDCENSIQVGDMGVGFIKQDGWDGPKYMINPSHSLMVKGNHRFIRGNHDSPYPCRKHSQCIPDGTVEGQTMFIGGAFSIDKAFRTENYDWWEDEELSQVELDAFREKYLNVKPTIMVTHDCPQDVAKEIYRFMASNTIDETRTRRTFQEMWQGHSPKVWVFGHWHYSFDCVLNNTRFVCLNELEAKEIDTPS